MRRVVWKYAFNLSLANEEVFEVPTGAVLRHCAAQGDMVALWLECDPEAVTELRRFLFFVTGQYVPDQNLVFRGTALFDGGSFVVHVYEDPTAIRRTA